MSQSSRPKRYRTIWISDLHLGTRACQAEVLLDFLKRTESETLYLVGDIFDGRRLRKTWYWPQSHNDVIQKLLRKAREGSRLVYLPGNHDEGARQFVGLTFGAVQIVEEIVHTTADGRRFLVIHGDQFDVVVRYAKWLARIGDTAYGILLGLNTIVNAVRRRLGYPYWPLSAYLKHRTKKAVEYLGRFENALCEEARRRDVDGVICGHVHTAEIKDITGFAYVNDGDWVESCTALVEHQTGELEILCWAGENERTRPARLPIPAKAAA